jgi:hypothetical protein
VTTGLTTVMMAAAPAVASPRPPGAQELVGTIHLVPGACHHGRPSGSYLAVTFGTRAVRNSSSPCGKGTFTLLQPDGAGVVSGRYSSAARSVFDGDALGLATSSASYAGPPRLYLVAGKVNADVRSVVASYRGGAYPIGAERATGRYDAHSKRISLQWFSGESFTAASAATEVHLEGTFQGAVKSVAKGTTVNLGTASFAAGRPVRLVDAASTNQRGQVTSRHHGRRAHHRAARLAGAKSTTGGNPTVFLIAELVVVANILAFAGLSRKRGRK